MTEIRRITVEQEDPRAREYDRDVRIELWHNQHQTTSLKLNHEEALLLKQKLAEFLYPVLKGTP